MPDADFWTHQLNAEQAAVVWHKAAPLIEPSLHLMGGLYEIDDIRQLVTQPNSGTEFGWSLWMLAEGMEMLGAWTTEVRIFPRGKVLTIGFAGGRGFARYSKLAIGRTEEYARSIGCTRMHGGGRKGWARFGFDMKYWHERILL